MARQNSLELTTPAAAAAAPTDAKSTAVSAEERQLQQRLNGQREHFNKGFAIAAFGAAFIFALYVKEVIQNPGRHPHPVSELTGLFAVLALMLGGGTYMSYRPVQYTQGLLLQATNRRLAAAAPAEVADDDADHKTDPDKSPAAN